jgi:hypothetical protein
MRYRAGISGEAYEAMEDGYEQGLAAGQAERDDLRHRVAKAEGSRDMLLASARLREERDGESVRAALDELESRIREQAAAVGVGSMAWRAHMADVMHVTEVRRARVGGASTGESPADEAGSDH